MAGLEPLQLDLITAVSRRLRMHPCRLDLGLFQPHDGSSRDKLTLSSWIVETAALLDSAAGRRLPSTEEPENQAGRLLDLTDEEALRLFRVTYWNEPFASACIFSAYEYLDELSAFKFNYSLTETQEQNSRKVLRLFAYQTVVEICFLRMMYFFATGKTDEQQHFKIERMPLRVGFTDIEDIWKRVDFLRRVPVEKVNEILRCRNRGWLFGDFNPVGLSAGQYI